MLLWILQHKDNIKLFAKAVYKQIGTVLDESVNYEFGNKVL